LFAGTAMSSTLPISVLLAPRQHTADFTRKFPRP
jgi:hypothetical protein